MDAVLAPALIALAAIQAIPTSLQWRNDYGQALQAARNRQRPLLVVIDDTSRAQNFDLVRLASDANQVDLLSSYELCKVDAATTYGRSLASVFRAQEFPFVAITDKTGAVITYRHEGKLARDQWVATLVSRRNGERTVYAGQNNSGESTFNSSWNGFGGRMMVNGRMCFT